MTSAKPSLLLSLPTNTNYSHVGERTSFIHVLFHYLQCKSNMSVSVSVSLEM